MRLVFDSSGAGKSSRLVSGADFDFLFLNKTIDVFLMCLFISRATLE